jgi:hypothetical protein
VAPSANHPGAPVGDGDVSGMTVGAGVTAGAVVVSRSVVSQPEPNKTRVMNAAKKIVASLSILHFSSSGKPACRHASIPPLSG